ncbi:MAG: C4-dicarboxylate ABC transporter [Phyllobacteriaceae bacterium]|nr:C4-dicarboxylate ABC transporter [Phyllobacteriaceae bacterium]MBA90954.1 C4-dicarboxylate ABC transporter [Phyllobacteriaceae bacterium]
MSEAADRKRPDVDVDMMVAEVESGARNAAGMAGRFILALCFIWSLFQLYIASDIPFILTTLTGANLVFNNQEARQVHLAFALALSMLAYPLFKSSPRDRVPLYDWALAILGAGACLYLLWFKQDIADRAGLPTTADLVMSTIGMVALAIAVYRALGLPLVIVASVFVFYVFFGHLDAMPDAIQWKGASFGKAMWHYWMQTEGVFGVALGVSASMIFLFVLFGSLLEKAGAGNYFIKLAFALLGHLRGGPAKAAVMASALSGLYSGSSIANVVTTGTFTIPLMKRTGFKPEKAGAVEVASSTNGQLTPPVMGAAAFLISEFTGVAYPELIKHAFLPAVISYIALVYIVHLEALKIGLKGLERPTVVGTLAQRLSGVLFGFIAMAVLAAAVYYGLGWIKVAFPGMTFYTALLLFLIAYVGLVYKAAQQPDLEMDDPNAPMEVLPRPWDVAITGFHYILPIVILIWCILVERLSPTLSAYWATVSMIFIVLTQKPLKRAMRGEGGFGQGFSDGWRDFVDGMIAGARNMIGIGVATGAAGVIVGTVSLTGAHQVVGEFVEFLSGGSLIAMLLLVAVMSLILGMGLPTTANYIVVSSLMAPVIVSVGAAQGLIVPLVAVHLFVFYFGILADDTPPVGLAAFAAAAISGGDPIRTGIQGFTYDIRTALLPFLFIFNTELLLIDVTAVKAVFIFIVAVVAMMLFAAATQGYFLTRSRIWETLALLLVAFTLFRPGFWLDYVQPPYDNRPGAEVIELAAAQPEDGTLRMVVRGPDFDKPDVISERTIIAELGAAGDGADRLDQAGLMVSVDDGKAVLEEPLAGTQFFTEFQGFDFYGDEPVEIALVQTEAERMPKEIFYIPALVLLGVVVAFQRRRQTVPAF